jgi:hypothetical protein
MKKTGCATSTQQSVACRPRWHRRLRHDSERFDGFLDNAYKNLIRSLVVSRAAPKPAQVGAVNHGGGRNALRRPTISFSIMSLPAVPCPFIMPTVSPSATTGTVDLVGLRGQLPCVRPSDDGRKLCIACRASGAGER